MTETPARSIAERIAQHLAAKDHPAEVWAHLTAACRAAYLAEAREVVAAAGLAPATDRAALRQGLVRVLHELHLRRDFDADEFVAEVLSVLPASIDRAALMREEAARIRAHCPDHLDSDSVPGAWMVCHCAVADDLLRRVADETPQQPEAEEPTEEQIVREHVTTVHLIGEQLTAVESWMWERLAEIRAAAPAVVAQPDGEA